ncbi:rhomboid family intramembrane serine protease [Halorussus halophilus]|uniref:rhomboid family intramembrane serine protease n=1 Tax=Halorussus halophilus TaxID=2650975 RepID=UPI0013013DDF|nr:rhomboid family intramembrane serine protease [Halorussus halophilus]
MGQSLTWLPSPEQVAIPLAFLLSVVLVWVLDRPRGRWGRKVRSRFLLGVPWGTVVSVVAVVSVYLFVQQGWDHWFNPVTLPFSSWSYLYPTGWLLAPFSHNGASHLVGNMTSTLAVAPLAEYYFSHYPTKRGERSFGSWRTNPWIRAFVLFPVGVFVVGLATSIFAWGPIIGFSGVVFAFAGFAAVRYPLGAVVALSVQSLVRTVYLAMRDPVILGTARPGFNTPWWYGIAVQGHALGLFLGIVLGVALLYQRRERPSALRLWTGLTVMGTSMSLWALWWYRGESTYVLYRGLGIVFVVVVALLATLAARASDRSLPAVPTRRHASVGLASILVLGWALWRTLGAPAAFLQTVPIAGYEISALSLLFGTVFVAISAVGVVSSEKPLLPQTGITRKQTAYVALMLPLAVFAGVAIPVNMTDVQPSADAPGEGPTIDVNGYTVTYAESVPNEKVSVIDVSLFGETTDVQTSGVIVVNPDREIWARAVSKGQLAFTGRTGIRVGGVGWSEVVRVNRAGWKTVHGETAYQVWLKGPEMEGWRHTFASDPATAGPTLEHKDFAVVPQNGKFFLRLSENNSTVATAPMPAKGENVTIEGIEFERKGKQLFAETNGTRIRVAAKESYR